MSVEPPGMFFGSKPTGRSLAREALLMAKLHGFPAISPYTHLSGSVAVFCSFADRIDCGAAEVFGCLLLGSASADPMYAGWLAAALEWQERVAGISSSVDDLSDCRCPSRDDSLQHPRPISSYPQLCTQQPSCLTLTHVWHQHRQLLRLACNALGVLGYGEGEGPWTLRGSSFISHQIWSAGSPFL